LNNFWSFSEPAYDLYLKFERFQYFKTLKEVQMIPDYNPVTQALLGTLFTWAVTALGSALVFVFNSGQVTF